MRIVLLVMLLCFVLAQNPPPGFNKILELLQKGRHSQARIEATALEQKYPNDVAVLNIQSVLSLELGEFQQSLLYSEKAMKLSPTTSLLAVNKAKALRALERYQDAVDALLAVDRQTTNLPAVVGLGKDQQQPDARMLVVQELQIIIDVIFQNYANHVGHCAEAENVFNCEVNGLKLLKVCQSLGVMYADKLCVTADAFRIRGKLDISRVVFKMAREAYKSNKFSYVEEYLLHLGRADTDFGYAEALVSSRRSKEATPVLLDCERHIHTALRLVPELSLAYEKLGRVYLLMHEYRKAADTFFHGFRLERGESFTSGSIKQYHGPTTPKAYLRRPDEDKISQFKLLHDVEQFDYLIAAGVLPRDSWKPVCREYKKVAKSLATTDTQTHSPPVFYKDSGLAVLPTFNRAIHIAPALFDWWHEEDEDLFLAVNTNLDWDAIETHYHENGVAVVDGFLTDEALEDLTYFCQRSTVWNAVKDGYIGAYLRDGFFPPVLQRLVVEIEKSLPTTFKHHSLYNLWAYKYDNDHPDGINLHADSAAINMNFWLTEDSANEDPDGGGIIVYKSEPSLDTDFRFLNNAELDRHSLRQRLEQGEMVRVPYKRNRMVFFRSNMWHETDKFKFKKGYPNRRINVTLLFGHREALPDVPRRSKLQNRLFSASSRAEDEL